MPIPVVPIALAGAAGVGAWLLFFRKKADGSPGGLLSPAKPGAPGSPGAPASTDMPADIRAAYQELLARGTNADALEIAANKMEAAGFRAEAAQLRAKAAQLRANAKPGTPIAPVAPVSPVAPVGPAPLPILPYSPDLSPLPVGASSASYYYDPSNGKRAKINVRDDARALRFLGYAAPTDPGGGSGLAADRNGGQGSWHPAMLDAVKHFQMDEGLTADGWLGPNTLTRLGQKVAAKNASNASANQSRGVADVTFSGVRRELFGRSLTPSRERCAYAAAPLRLRASPQRSAGGTNYAPEGSLLSVLQILPGPKAEPAAPGPGGWTLVRYGAVKGWVPSEWLRGGT